MSEEATSRGQIGEDGELLSTIVEDVVTTPVGRVGAVVDSVEVRSYSTVFNDIADDYDRQRPAYPDVLVDRACEAAGLAPGARVLEIGCGTGQLTRSLLERGLRVVAVEPGEQLLPRAHCRAVFSASAMHWVDPDVSWRKVADALVDDGTVALLSYFGLQDSRSGEDQQALRAAVARVAPERQRVANLPRPRWDARGRRAAARQRVGSVGMARKL